MRKPVIAGNWKMYKRLGEAVGTALTLRSLVSNANHCEVVIAPVFVHLKTVADRLEGSNVKIAAPRNTEWIKRRRPRHTRRAGMPGRHRFGDCRPRAWAFAGRESTVSADAERPLDSLLAFKCRLAAVRFEALGCRVEEVDFDASDLVEIIAGTRSFGMVARYAERYDRHKEMMTQQLRNQIEAAFQMDVRSIVRAERLRTGYWRRITELMSKYDYVVTPACGAPPFRLDEPLPETVGGKKVTRFYDVFLTTYGFSVTGLPIVSLPCGTTSVGLPVGIQLVARRQREDLAIEAAAAYAAHSPEFFRRPDIDKDQARPIPPTLPTPGMVMR